ncbi:MAG: Asp-tRNA(Asn)/Glu-tRNA(Gln) amidotransferase subunit GatA [Candidatus Omnitrophica bacterium]|nr:Asp-tRNA(Asn)/Glu-tRNA(Gln) amidotransferase subunit GatA [Candidatus Omnitrophota bacterium]
MSTDKRMPINIENLKIHRLLELYRTKELNPKEVIDCLFSHIEKIEPKIKAFVHFNREKITKELENIPQKEGKLKGIPVTIKDNICVKDEPTTCASKILGGFSPPYDATVVERLKREGAILFGKANMDEFAFGSSCETSFYGPTHNPWNTSCVPGGSSGGSAAAVASDETVASLGSDTGGSIRQPASFCGIVGLKPTYGRVSRYGLVAFASSLDQIGPLTKDVKDCALLMNVIAGYDEKDSTSVNIPVPDYTKALVKDIRGMKIGVPREYFLEGIDKEVKKAIEEAITLIKDLKAEVKEVSLPHTEYAVATYYIIATAEASSNLARFDGVQYGYRTKDISSVNDIIQFYSRTRKEGFGAEAKRRIMLGTYVLSHGYYDAYYLRALKVRTLIRKDFEEAFKECDIILTPTSPTPPFRMGEKTENPLAMYLSDIYTISVNLAGVPAISLPCGFTNDQLPIGMQLIGKPFDEETIFRLAYTYEQNTDWHYKKPKL